MKKMLLLQVLLISSTFSFAQPADKSINAAEAERIERILSSDQMAGRKTFSPEIDKAADFIANEFTKAGLKNLPGLNSYKQSFEVVKTKFLSAEGKINGKELEQNDIIAITTQPEVSVDEHSGYSQLQLDSTADVTKEAARIIKLEKNYLVLVNPAQKKIFSILKRFKRTGFKTNYTVLFVLSAERPTTWSFSIKHDISTSPLANVAGMLPGRSKKDEYVVFSCHYDHLGVTKPNAAMDSVYNGANDDAAGITSVIMLANYFSKLNDNERSIIFVAFTAEEIGGYGSRYFSNHTDPDKVVAMFNIEMIGTQSKWGNNSAYITGYERSDFGKILQSNLQGSDFHFEPDPYPTQNLFYRSDNATLAALGVPAHTISSSQMDSDKYYHTLDDEIETLDLPNLAAITTAIAFSSKTIISGKDTPTRIEKKVN